MDISLACFNFKSIYNDIETFFLLNVKKYVNDREYTRILPLPRESRKAIYKRKYVNDQEFIT